VLASRYGSSLEQHDEASRPDAADADDLEGEVDEPVALEERPPVLGHRRPIVAERPLEPRGAAGDFDVRDDGRVVEDDAASTDDGRQRLERLHAVPATSLGEHGLDGATTTTHLGTPAGQHARGLGRVADARVGDRRVPDVHQGHAGKPAHPLPIATDRGHGRLAAVAGREPVCARGDHHAGGEPLDVPFPGSGQRLVEVVGIEHERALGRGKQAEVRQMRITADLDLDVRLRGVGEVEGHDGRRAPVIGEGGLRHPRMAQRDKLLQPVRLLLVQDRDRITARPRLEHGVRGPRDALACRLRLLDPIRRVHPGPRRREPSSWWWSFSSSMT
jgi:hypothetical protein